MTWSHLVKPVKLLLNLYFYYLSGKHVQPSSAPALEFEAMCFILTEKIKGLEVRLEKNIEVSRELTVF